MLLPMIHALTSTVFVSLRLLQCAPYRVVVIFLYMGLDVFLGGYVGHVYSKYKIQEDLQRAGILGTSTIGSLYIVIQL